MEFLFDDEIVNVTDVIGLNDSLSLLAKSSTGKYSLTLLNFVLHQNNIAINKEIIIEDIIKKLNLDNSYQILNTYLVKTNKSEIVYFWGRKDINNYFLYQEVHTSGKPEGKILKFGLGSNVLKITKNRIIVKDINSVFVLNNNLTVIFTYNRNLNKIHSIINEDEALLYNLSHTRESGLNKLYLNRVFLSIINKKVLHSEKCYINFEKINPTNVKVSANFDIAIVTLSNNNNSYIIFFDNSGYVKYLNANSKINEVILLGNYYILLSNKTFNDNNITIIRYTEIGNENFTNLATIEESSLKFNLIQGNTLIISLIKNKKIYAFSLQNNDN